MASVARDPNGRKRILFTDGDGKRHTIRLGKVGVKAAEATRLRIEHLLACKATGTAPDAQLAAWVRGLPDDLHDRLGRVGLVEPRASQSCTLGGLLDDYFAALDVKPSTRTRYKQARRLLGEHFGEDRTLRSITPRDADLWRAWLVERGYAEAKIAREVGIAKMFFRAAARWELIERNPLEGVKTGSQRNRERLYFVTPEDTRRLIDSAPDHDWRCIIALARWGGLRTPSETTRVRWEDVDWDRGRLRVRSPKTEHHDGKGERTIPLFPELAEVLIAAFEDAEPAAEFVVGRYGGRPDRNLGTHLKRLIRRAGLTPWPRAFNALRASRATELAAEYPAAVCTAWMGHTAAIAEAHYHMVRDEDFAKAAARTTPGKAAQNAAQHPAAGARIGSRVEGGEPASRGSERGRASERNPLRSSLMGVTGLEPVTSAM